MKHVITIAAIGFISLAPVGCRDVGNLHRLAIALNEQFPGQRLGVSLTSEIILTVTTTDSVLALASCETQVGFAMRVGRLLPGHYPDLDSLQVVNVSFALDPEQGEIPVRLARLPIRFRPSVLRAGLQAQDSASAVASCRAYEELNQPD